MDSSWIQFWELIILFIYILCKSSAAKETFSVVAIDNDGNSSVRSESHSTVFSNSIIKIVIHFIVVLEQLSQYVFMDGYQLKAIREDIQTGTVSQEQTIAISSDDTSFSFPVEYSSKYTLWLEALSSLVICLNLIF